MLTLLALSAIILPLILLVIFRLPARIGMPISALVLGLIAWLIWQMSGLAIAASILQGTHRAVTILWILTGALLFLFTLKNTGAIERIRSGFHKLTEDMRIQTVLVAFLFVSLIEGVAGFGTPAAIAVPLLLALGFRPLAAVTLALAGDSVATSFGAVGTPFSIGLANVTADAPGRMLVIAELITMIDFLAATLLPAGLVAILVIGFGRKSHRWQDIKEVLPWSLAVGFIYAFSALIISRLIGFEFTSIVSASIGLIFGFISVQRGWLQPEKAWRHHEQDEELKLSSDAKHVTLLRAWLPYGLVIILLLVQRVVPFIKEFSQKFLDLSWNQILGFENISSAWSLLYSPGTALIIAALFAALIQKADRQDFQKSLAKSLKTVVMSALALIPTLVMVQIFSNSGINGRDLLAMPAYIGHSFAGIFGQVWIAFAPLLGTITSFITGSSTISTLTMSPVQQNVATEAGLMPDFILALHISGSNAGNVIAIHNVVAASVVAGLAHREGLIIRRTIIPAIGYLLISTLSGLIIYTLINQYL